MADGFGDFIERKRAERRREIMQHGVRVGDFINPIDCFGDIWYEVVQVYAPTGSMARYASCSVVRYSKYGRNRALDSFYFGDIRKVLRKENVPQTIGIFHTVTGKRGTAGVFEWPTAAGPHTRFRGNGSDRMQEWHPNPETLPMSERGLP